MSNKFQDALIGCGIVSAPVRRYMWATLPLKYKFQWALEVLESLAGFIEYVNTLKFEVKSKHVTAIDESALD